MDHTWSVVLAAIVHGRNAWSNLDEIAAYAAIDARRASATIKAMQSNGLLEAFGAAWTLTPLGAAGLNVVICEHGDDNWQWAPAGEGDPPSRPGLRACMETRRHAEAVASIPDPAPGPEEIAAGLEEDLRAWRGGTTWNADQLPRPRILLMGGASTWTEARRDRPARGTAAQPPKPAAGAGACPACMGRRLPTTAYCLRCDRWGFDGLIAARQKARTKRDRRRAG